MKQIPICPMNADLNQAHSRRSAENRGQTMIRCLSRLASVFLLALAALLISLFWLLGHPQTLRAAGGVHYVTVNGVDSANCSLSTPCQTIQQAVTNAANGDEIRVAAGGYITVTLNKSLTLRGGFTTTNWLTPNPVQNPTIINAQGSGRVIEIAGPVAVTVSGFHLTGGSATVGAGVYNPSGNLTLIDNQIYNNVAAANGGGVYNQATLTSRGNQVYSNTANVGGGLYFFNVGTTVVETTRVFSNAALFGGGIYIENGPVTVRSSLIYSNVATTFLGGGGIFVQSGNVKLENDTIYDNDAIGLQGGGIYAYAGTLAITNGLIVSNTAVSGGGIYSDSIGSGLNIAYTDFFGNLANELADGSGVINPTTIGPNNRISNPQFVNPQTFDLHLTNPGSPALDTGTPNTSAAIDIDGEGRPFGTGMDRGADEYTDLGSTCYARVLQTGQVYTNLQTAVDAAGAGGTVQVAGRCVSSTGQQQTLLLNKNLTVRGGYTVTDWLNARYGPTLLDASSQGRVISVTAAAAVTLDSLHITGGLVNGDGAGVYLDSTGLATLQNNVIYGNTASGGASNGGGVYNSGRGNAILQHNTIYGNTAGGQGGGVYANSASGGTVTLRNSIIANNTGWGIATSLAGRLISDYNSFYNNTITHTNGPVSSGPNSLIDISPVFENPAATPPNLHLQYTSPLIDAADPASSLVTDFDDDARPQGARRDIGADESATYPGVALSDALGRVVTDVNLIRGTWITFNHTITNTGNNPGLSDTFNLTVTNSNGWPVTLLSPTIALSSGASLSFDVVVSVPFTITGGIYNQTIVTATAQTNPAVYDMTIDLIANPGAQLVPNYEQSAKPGETLTYTHILTNIGPVTDTFTLALNSSMGWGQLVTPTGPIILPAGGSTLITVSVRVTDTAPANLSDVSTLIATSANYAISASAVDTTTAKATVGDRYVATSGRDTDNNCTQSVSPCATIKHAVSQAAFSDTVRVAVGVYPESGININQFIHLRGGLSGDWTTPDPNPSVIDAQNSGRALLIEVTSAFRPLVEGFTIRNGTGDGGVGGAIYVKGTSAPTLTRLIILNSSATRGGGIYLENGNPVLQQITISNTTASQHGGGIYQAGGTATITSTRISGSVAANSGGGLYSAGGVLNLWNNFIYNNTATSGSGGGVYKGPGVLSLVNNTLVNNQAGTSGGGIAAVGSSGIISNNIVVSNTAATGGGIYRSGGSLTANYNDIWNNAGGNYSGLAAGLNDISANPLFIDTANGNLHLSLTSPAVDQGDPNTFLNSDIDHDRRPANQGFDMGADELQGCLAQIDGSSTIYDILQQAVDVAPDGATVKISGICLGAKPRLVNGQVMTQTVIVTKNLTLKGGYNSAFDNDPELNPEPTILDALGQGRTAVITNAVAVTISRLTLTGGDGATGGNNTGGGIYNGDAQLKVATSVISGNQAAAGGGIYQLAGTLILGGETVTDSTRVFSNTATNGGGLYVQAGSTLVTRTLFAYNIATNGGGGLYNSGGLTLVNALVFNNTATNGGGLYNLSDALVVRHDTFYANSATQGGGIYNNSAGTNPLVNSTLLVSNTASAGSAIFTFNALDFGYNDLFNNNANFPLDPSNLSVDPNFLSLDPIVSTFLHLAGGSPVEDRGDPASPITEDIDDDPRPSNQNFDIGADEVGGCFVRVNDIPITYGNIMVAVATLGSSSTISDVVKVAGTCQGVQPAVDGGQTINQTVFLTKSLTLRGGYNKDNWQLPPDPAVYTTTLDALNLGRVVYITNSAVISMGGFHIRQGTANNGGAIFVGSGVLTLTNNFVYSSTATNGAAGYNAGGNVTFDSNQLRHNQASNNGGAFYHANGTSTLQNNIIRNNTAATNGGGIYNSGNNLTVRHNTVYSNSATNGGGFFTTNNNPTLLNNIFANNIAPTGHAIFGPAGYAPDYNDTNPATNAYGGGATAGPNSLTDDPLLVNPAVGDFHLQPTSPVLDRGDPAMTLDHDFEGDFRPGDQGFDMGADEQASCRARILRTGIIYGTIQRAVNNSIPGDTIQVSVGECRGVHTYIDGGKTLSQTVHILHDLTLHGGFSTDFSSGGTSGPSSYPDPNASTINALSLGRNVLVTNSATITILRFILVNGNATGLGGGLGGGDAGGGLYYNGSRGRIEHVDFYSNTATYGGAFFNAGTNFEMFNSWIHNNTATDGGAIFNWTGVMTITGELAPPPNADESTVMANNRATNRGGAIFNDSGRLWLLNNTFDQLTLNQANQGGFAYNNTGQMTLENNAIAYNDATTGGALYNNSGALTLDRGNRLYQNQATGDGGAIYNNGGALTAWNTLIYGNTSADQGAGIYSAGGNPAILHNTFYANQATNQGGGVYIAAGNADIRNNIFDTNAASGGSAVYAGSGSTLNYNDYYLADGAAQVAGGANPGVNSLNEDPDFVNASNADFHLNSTSPLINVGLELSVPRDFEDDPRPINTAPDIGADEYNACLAMLISSGPNDGNIYGRIQTALNAAVSGDTIRVAEGVCEESITISKDITIIGSWRRDFTAQVAPLVAPVTIIDALNANRVVNVSSAASSVNLSWLNLTNGNTGSDGGGLYNQAAQLTLSNMTVVSNTAVNGGGIYISSGTVTISGGGISNNVASGNGGGLYNNTGSIVHVTGGFPIDGNQAQNGGGIFNNGATFTLINKQVNENQAIAGDGGGIYIAGASTVELTNLNLYNNSATGNGAGLYRNASGSAALYHATIHQNNAQTGQGGGVYNANSSMVISASIVAFNTSASGGSGVHGAASVNVAYTLRENSNTYSGVSSGVGNIDGPDPQLREPGGDLLYTSPAIDAVPTAASLVTIDRYDEPRPQLCAKDMGRDEYWVGARTLTWLGPTPPGPETVAPTEAATYTFSLRNDSENWTAAGLIHRPPGTGYTETLTLTLNSSQNWGELIAITGGANPTIISGTLATVTLGPGQVVSLTVRVTVPAGTLADRVDASTLSYQAYQCAGDPPATGPSSPAVTNVELSRKFIIAPDNFGAALPGETITYSHIITNLGNLTDTYTIVPGANQYAPGQIVYPPAPFTLTLAPLQTSTLTMAVTIDAAAAGGLLGRTNIVGISQGDPTLQESALDTTAISYTTGTRHVSLDGSDSIGIAPKDNNCTQRDTAPCRTIQQAIDQAAPGDLIKIEQGVYSQVYSDILTTTYKTQVITQVAFIDESVTLQGGYDKNNWDENPPNHISQTTTLDPQGLGRGIFVTEGVTPTIDRLTIVNGNAAGLGGGPGNTSAGGAIYNEGSDLTVSAVRLANSVAEHGGGLYSGGGDLLLQNNLLHGNTAVNNGNGGALYVDSGTATLQHDTFYNNGVQGTGNGGAAYVNDGNFVVTNTIVATNTGNAFYLSASATPDILDYNLYYGNTTNDYVEDGSPTAPPGTNNVFNDPEFVNPTSDPPNLNLRSTSLAVDANLTQGLAIDYANTLRPQGPGFDLGAYERTAVRNLLFYSDTITSTLAPSTIVVTHTVENIGEQTEVITISASSTQAWATFSQSLPYTLTLTSGMSQTVVVTYNVPAGTEGQTNVTVITATASVTTLFRTVTDIINVRSVAWQIGKTVTPTPTVQPGEYLTYTITITNTGDLETQGSYTVTDELPNDTNFVSADNGGILVGSTVQWVTDTTVLSNNGTMSFSYVVTVTKPLTDGTPIVNQTYGVTGGGAPNPASGSPVIVTVTAPATLTVSKTASPSPVQPGDTLTYTLTLTNDVLALGPALNPFITDTLPAEVVYQDMGFVSPAAGLTSAVGSALRWDLAQPIQPGEAAQVTVTVRLTSPLAANTVLTNTFGATASNIAAPVTGLLTTPVTATNNILLQKTVVPTQTGPGGVVTYTITLSNTGNGVAAVTLTDTLAPDFTPAVYNTSVVIPGRTWSTTEGSASVSFTATAPITPGVYSNTLITAAYDQTQTTLSDTAPVTVEAPLAELSLSKTPDLQMVQSGGATIFTITLTNTGNVALVPVEVGDPLAANCEQTVGSLAVGATASYTCTESNVTASFTNTAVATGTAALGGQVVTVTDTAVVQVITPALTISKTPDTQLAQSGNTVTFTITITNSGDVDLTNVTVSDVFASNCNQSLGDLTVGAGSSYTCTLTVTADLTNTATVTGTPPAGLDVTASDDAFVNVISPSLQIGKTPDSQFALSGDTVTFTITVTNTGDVDLDNVTVGDALAPNCDQSLGNLAVGASSSYTCTLTVTADLTNTATVTGAPPLGSDVTASDDAFVDVISPAIQISKTPDAQTIARNDTAAFTITVTNTGDITLTNVTVSDAQAPGCNQSLGDLASGAITTYTCSRVNVLASFTNVAIVSGTPPTGPDVTASDDAQVNVVGPNLEISKTPDSQDIVSGSTVTFTITLTNSGDITMTTVDITDGPVPACDQTFSDLAPGAIQSYDCSRANVTTDLTNTVVATGAPAVGQAVIVSDTAFVNVVVPSLTIAKTPDSQFALSGGTVTFTITVTNTGDVVMNVVTVTDVLASDCNRTTNFLFQGFTWMYTCTLAAVSADLTNTALVTGTPAVGSEVIASDDAFVDVINPAITIAKTPDTQVVQSGSSALFTITVTNTGDITLTNVQVADTPVSACNRTIGDLSAGSANAYTCAQPNVTAAFTNTATVTGTPPLGSLVTSTDTAVVTVITPALTIAKTPDLQVANNGDVVTFTITVTNTGDVPLAPITIADPLAPACNQVIASLAAGNSSNYNCTMVAGATDITNLATATGVPPAGPAVVASDTAFVDTTPPARPILLSPPNLSYTNNPTVTFSWLPTAESVTYTLNLNGATYDVAAPGSSQTFTGLADGVYTWTVRSVDAYSRTQGYTNSWTVTVDTTPPPAPTLITPTNGLTVTPRPFFDWSDVTDALSGPVTYTISIVGVGDFVTSTSSFTPLADLPAGVYTWSVRAHDQAGNTSAPSAVYTFTVEIPVRYVYLPLILNGTSVGGLPDLRPIQLTVQPATGVGPSTPVVLSVVIQNVGTAPAPANFWVDFYINPSAFPTEAGHVWSDVCPTCYGLAWQVRTSLAVGQVITLTSAPGDPYLVPAYTRWPGSFNQSGLQRLGAYVDSWDGLNKPQGFILESNETNNLITRSDVVVSGSSASGLEPNAVKPIPDRPLPER